LRPRNPKGEVEQYIDVPGLFKENPHKLILSHEQYFLNLIFSGDKPNTYNLLKVAGSLLGYQHTKGTIAKMKDRTLSAETKALISEACLVEITQCMVEQVRIIL